MRILAIRGENLASLAERFEIDFETEPLRGAGLFAITGETGAGKSTILDALCLALYDAFPRVAAQGVNEGIPDPSGQNVSASDPRSILRRGAGHGFAEVDFIGRDGARYRARCDLARARNKATGRLQQRGRALHRLDDDGAPAAAVASGVEQVRTKIVELTDLTFDQFRRTVLLAQGDFDAFLRSDSKERADLLEKITGTSIYADISRRVYQRAKDALDAAQALRQRRDDIGLLAEDARLALDTERADIDEKRRVAASERDAVVSLLRRHEAIAQAEARLADAAARQDAALAALDTLASARERLRDLERAEPLRAPLTQRRSSETALEQAIASESDKRGAAAKTLAALETTLADEAAAAKAVEAAEAAFKAFGPDWTKAERLDSEIDVATGEEEKARDAALSAAQTAQEKAAEETVLAEQSASACAELETAREALKLLAAAEPLHERWNEIAATIEQRGELGKARARDETRARDTASDIDRRGAALAALDDANLRELAERDSVDGQLTQRRGALEALGEAEASKRWRGLDEFGRLVARLAAEAKRYAKAKQSHGRAALDLGAARHAEDIESRAIAAAQEGRDHDEARRGEVERLGELADAATSKEALRLRASLVDGAPCPVCGASDHPHAHASAAAGAFIAELRARRDELRQSIAAAEKSIASASAQLAAAQARAADAHRRCDDAVAEQDEAARGYDSLRADWPAGGVSAKSPAIEDALAALDAVADSVTRESAAVAGKLERAQMLRGEIEVLRQKYDRLGAAIEARRKERDEIAAGLSEARAETARLAASLDGVRERLRVIDASLAPFLPLCGLDSADLDRNLEGAARRLEQQGEAYRQARNLAETLELRLAELSQRRNGANAEARAAAAAAHSRQHDWQERKRALDELRGKRAELLGGEATASHRTRCNDSRLAAQAARDAATSRRADAAAAKAGADRDLANAADALEAARAQRERAGNAFAAALAATALDDVAALALLNASGEERTSLRAQIDAADKAAASAQTEAAARAKDLAEALAAGRPEDDVAALEARRAQAEEALEALARRLGEIAAQIAADDAARRKAAALAADIDAADAAHKTWAEVDAAIGSANGDKFRRFAQSVTLDHLVALANRHLSTLSSRYRLERSPSEAADLGLQIIDRDLGDERRSTRSLSGGERFLASLALALGLCSLEGRGSFVDTLFIDEGFGTLDATTLDIAIDALESLQGQGRKVGLISHVELMHQRIPVQIRVEKRGGGKSAIRIDARAIGIA